MAHAFPEKQHMWFSYGFDKSKDFKANRRWDRLGVYKWLVHIAIFKIDN